MSRRISLLFIFIAVSFFFLSCQRERSADAGLDLSSIRQEIAALQSQLTEMTLRLSQLSSRKADSSAVAIFSVRADSLHSRIGSAESVLDSLSRLVASEAGALAELDDRVTDRLAAIRTDVDDLGLAVNSIIAQFAQSMDELRSMIHSVVFVPEYAGGCAVFTGSPDLTLDYEILPRKCALAVAREWKASGRGLSVSCRTVSTRSSVSGCTLPVTAVEFDSTDSLLSVTVNVAQVEDVILLDDRAVSVSLVVDAGSTSASSAYTDIMSETFVNLSKDGTANCYVVSGAGNYKFDATVMGNGTQPDGSAAPALAPAGADVLWESFGTGESPTSGDVVNRVFLSGGGFVHFTATDQKGNAVIAVKDGAGKILWSWHIWLTDAPEDQIYKNNVGAMLDRNLGALSCSPDDGVLSRGLLYQWGRKDPFLGQGQSSSFQSRWAVEPGPKEKLDYSVQNPQSFITSGTSSGGDWTKRNDKLWRSAAGSKTMYDPCPPGYIVPVGGSSGFYYKAGFSKTTGTELTGGFNFAVLEGGAAAFFPAAGWRDGTTGAFGYVGTRGFYWTSTVSTEQASRLYFLTNDVRSYYAHTRAGAYSMRCCKEK